ncbi:MAG: hypothetical protein AAF846_26950 [Chloroflexota bacterium]
MNRSDAGKKGYEKTKDQLDAHRQAKSANARTRYEENPKFCITCDEKIP